MRRQVLPKIIYLQKLIEPSALGWHMHLYSMPLDKFGFVVSTRQSSGFLICRVSSFQNWTKNDDFLRNSFFDVLAYGLNYVIPDNSFPCCCFCGWHALLIFSLLCLNLRWIFYSNSSYDKRKFCWEIPKKSCEAAIIDNDSIKVSETLGLKSKNWANNHHWKLN